MGSLISCFSALVLVFSRDSDTPTAVVLHSHLIKFQFVAVMLFMSDALGLLSRLSQSFQKDNINYDTVQKRLSQVRAALVVGYLSRVQCDEKIDPDSDYKYWCEVWNELSSDNQSTYLFSDPVGPQLSELMANTSTFQGVKLQGDKDSLENFKLFTQNFVVAILSRLSERFPKSDMHMLSLFEFLNPENIPHDNPEELRVYGEGSLKELINFYGKSHGEGCPAMIDGHALQLEWAVARETFAKHAKAGKGMQDAFEQMLTDGSLDGLPELTLLMQIRLVQTIQTACCERGFSKMKLIKSALRNRLYIETLDSLMTVSLLGPEFSLNSKDVNQLAEDAHSEWRLLCKRDPRQARFGNQNASKKLKMKAGGKTEIPLEHADSAAGVPFDEDADDEEALEAAAAGARVAWIL